MFIGNIKNNSLFITKLFFLNLPLLLKIKEIINNLPYKLREFVYFYFI